MPPNAQEPLYRPVLRFLASKKAKHQPPVLVAGLIILGYFRGERLSRAARAALLKYADRKNPPEVRRHALVSYHRLLGDGQPASDQVAALEKLLCDDDWHNVAQNALLTFQRVELPRPRVLKLTGLLHRSPHFSVHIHVFERLRGQDSREVARAIIPFLYDSRFRVRDAAEAALRSIPSAIEDLFGVLMDSEDSEVCQRVTGILREYPQEVKRRFVETATRRFMGLFDQNDTRYQFFFDFVQAIDAEPLRQRIYQKARMLKGGRSKDKWIKIGGYLQLLWDHHLITTAGRYLFAVALIRQSNKDLSPPARRANLGLRVLRALIYDDTPGLIGQLSKDPDIGPDEVFYIGFHFMEEGDEMRPFARALLDHLLRRYPKSRYAAPARQKLELHQPIEP
ncbi:MAG: HEAT repeat domain-containing protein, partial [Anaerolineales bacterium]